MFLIAILTNSLFLKPNIVTIKTATNISPDETPANISISTPNNSSIYNSLSSIIFD